MKPFSLIFTALLLITSSLQAYATETSSTAALDDSCSAMPACCRIAPTTSGEEQLDSFFTLYQPYITNISAYEPINFLVGTDPEKSKFQFSFKYRFLNDKGPLVGKYPWLKGFHFGFTQVSFWNLASESLPFEDTSYKPEIFHRSSNVSFRPSWMQGFFVQTGFQHESNGQSEELSRSTNYLYVRPMFIFYDSKSKYGLGISPKVLVYVNSEASNSDLADYRGYFELDFKLGKADGLILGSSLRWAKEGGSAQLDLTYPVSRYLSDNVDVYVHIQYVNSLAESLLHYQDRTEALRIGLSFIR